MTTRRLRIEWVLFGSLAALGLMQPACGGDAEGSSGTGGSTTSPTTSSGGGGMTTSSSTGGGGSTPVECPSGGTTSVPMGDCDLLQQDCPSGMGCKVVPDGDSYLSTCVPANGLKEPGSDCGGSSECGPGLECIFAKCTPPCCPGNHQPCEGGLCNVQNNQDFGEFEVFFCSYPPSCDLFDPMACMDGAEGNCYPTDLGFAFCAPPGPNVVGEGEACAFLNDCESNMFCYSGGGSGTCRLACYLDGSSTVPGEGGCPMGTTCSEVPLGFDNIGLCLP